MGNPESYKNLQDEIDSLRRLGACFACYDLATGDLFRGQEVIFEDDLFRVALDQNPRMRGHTIILYKPHREDISELSDVEAGPFFALTVRIVKAIKLGLGAEKVYINSMCDGGINHFHVQLLPRYPGDPIGSQRFVATRGGDEHNSDIARLIRNALSLMTDD